MVADPTIVNLIYSWVFGRVITFVYEKFFTKTLAAQLDSVAQEWAKHVPDAIRPDPYTLFTEHYVECVEYERPWITNLRAVLEKGWIPEQQNWLNALKEQWELVGTVQGDNAHIFFRQKWDVVGPHLRDLATILHETCFNDKEVAKKKIQQDIEKVINNLEIITQDYSLKHIVNRHAGCGGIPITEVIQEPLEEEPFDFTHPQLVAGPPNVGKTCWVVRQAWHWLQSCPNNNADVFLVNSSHHKDPSLIGTLVLKCPSEAPVLIIIDDIHYSRSNLGLWVDEVVKARESRFGNVFVAWVARDAELQDKLYSDKLERPQLYRFPVDKVLSVLSKRLNHLPEWQRVVVALETGLDPRLIRRFSPHKNSQSHDLRAFVDQLKDWVQEDTVYRVSETKDRLDEGDANAFPLYIVLLPAGSINYPLPTQFISEIGYLDPGSYTTLIKSGLAKPVGPSKLVLIEHPFQIRQILKLEEVGLLPVPTNLVDWFNYRIHCKSAKVSLSQAVLVGYLADQSRADIRLDELMQNAEWSGVRQPTADALKLLIDNPDWSFDANIKEKATKAYLKLSRTIFPDVEEQFVSMLKDQQEYWKNLQQAAERSGELRIGKDRLDYILYEIAYIDYLLESYKQAAHTFGRSVDAALEAIKRGLQSDSSDIDRKTGSDALAKFWVSAVLEKSATLRHQIKQNLIEGKAVDHQRMSIKNMTGLVQETASIWRKLKRANGEPKELAYPFYIEALQQIRPDWQPPSNGSAIIRTKEMEDWLARHEHNSYQHALAMACWPMLFGLTNQRIDNDVPGPRESNPGLSLPPLVGLPLNYVEGDDLLYRWTQHSKPSELTEAALATAAMRRAGGGYEYIGDLLLLAWRCTNNPETANKLKEYMLFRIPAVGCNGLSKTALERLGTGI